MAVLRNSLLCLFLGLLSVAALGLIGLINQISIVLGDAQAVLVHTGPPLTAAVYEMRGAAREQRSYYKATGKALFIASRDTARAVQAFGRLVQNTDHRSAVLFAQANATLETTEQAVARLSLDSHEALEAAQKQIEANGYEATLALAAARGNFEQMERLWPHLRRSVQNTEVATGNLAAATHSIKVALAPLEKPTGRLQWVLRWLLGLPKVNVR